VARAFAEGNNGQMGRLAPELIGPVALELARAVEQLPGERDMPGGSRYELKYDSYFTDLVIPGRRSRMFWRR
jgi:hypothetical protein